MEIYIHLMVLKVVLVKREFIGDSQTNLSRNMQPMDVKNLNFVSNQNLKFEIINLASVGLFGVANFVQD